MKKNQSVDASKGVQIQEVLDSVSPHQTRRVVNALIAQPMAVRPAYLELMLAVVDDHAAGRRRDYQPEVKQTEDGVIMLDRVAVVSVDGVIINRAGMMQRMSGATSPQAIRANVAAAFRDPTALAVAMVFNTPGGQVAQVPELADWLFAMKKENPRPLIGVVEGCCASAGYWLASQCDRIYASASSIVGSVGIITKVVDDSRQERNEGKDSYVLKTGSKKGTGYGPVTDEQLQVLREIQAEYFSMFQSAITRGRGRAPDDDVLTGREYLGGKAIEIGLIDAIGSLDDVVAEYGRSDEDEDEDEK